MKMESVLAVKGPGVVTMEHGATLAEAVALLVEHGIGAIVVLNGATEPIGIISERDIVREASRSSDFPTLLVRDVMTKDVIFGSCDDDVEAVLQTMTSHHFRHVPIVEDGKLVGIVSIGDLVKAQLDRYRGDIDTLETQLMNA
ncbi:MAG: CBS domain-containing protein [Gemmatimonadaceae bacterium]